MFKVGDNIKHNSFGTGCVQEVEGEGPETIMTVNFYKGSGLKKLRLKEAFKYITRLSEYRYYDIQTKDWYNIQGFNELGYDKNGFNFMGFNKRGFSRNGKYLLTNSFYDDTGYDINGYDKRGFNQYGIHKQTGTEYNPEGYNIKGNHKSEKLIRIINNSLTSLCELKFDGFYHMTHIDNAGSILRCEKLYSRSKHMMLYDMNSHLEVTNRVISNTDLQIQNHARLYLRPKTPTFWYFESLKEVVLLKFNKKLLTSHIGATISLGNAGKTSSAKFLVNEGNLIKIDFTKVFLSSKETRNEIEKNLRQTELLIPNFVDIKYLDMIIFRSIEDIKYFIAKYGLYKGITYAVNKSKFFKEFLE